MAEASRLHQLQANLVALKQQCPQLKLKKGVKRGPAQRQDSTPAAADPFPVHLSVSILAPPSAARYDVDTLSIALQLSSSILSTPIPAAAVSFTVTNPELPQRLKTVIAHQLHAAWAAATAATAASPSSQGPAAAVSSSSSRCPAQQQGSSTDPFGLHAVLQHAQQHFSKLITACPQYVEAYEGVDSNGATQRRYAIVCSTSRADEGDSQPVEAPAAPPAVVAAVSPVARSPAAAAGKPAPAVSPAAPAATSPAAAEVPPSPAHAVSPAVSPAAEALSPAAPPASAGPTASSGTDPAAAGCSAVDGSSRPRAADPAAAGLSASAAPFQPANFVSSDTAAAAAAAAPAGAPCCAGSEPPGTVPGHAGPPAAALQSTHHGLQHGSMHEGVGYGRGRGRGRGRGADAPHYSSMRHDGLPVASNPAGMGPQQQQHWQERQQPQQQQQQQQRQQWQQQDWQQEGVLNQKPVASHRGRGRGRGKGRGREGPSVAAALAAASALDYGSAGVVSLPDGGAAEGQQQQSADCGPAGSQLGLAAGIQQQQQQQQQHPGVQQLAAAGGGQGRTGRGRGRGGEGCFGPPPYMGRCAGRSAAADPQQQQQLPGHELAARDLQAAQRRYGRSFRMQQQEHLQEQQQQEFLGASQQQQQDPQQHQHHHQQQQQQEQVDMGAAPSHFSIMLRPTDPLWGASRGPLYVTGSLNPSLYPSPGSLSLGINPSRGVAAAEVWVLQEALASELAAQAGRAWQLRSLLRWLENYAGSELDKAFTAQQELLGAEEAEPEQQQQQQQQRRRLPHQKQQQQRAASRPAAVAPHTSPQGSRIGGTGSGGGSGIRIIRATQQQQQQQQQSSQQQQQQQSVGDLSGFVLKPLVRENEEASTGSWLHAAAGVTRVTHGRSTARHGSSSSSLRRQQHSEDGSTGSQGAVLTDHTTSSRGGGTGSDGSSSSSGGGTRSDSGSETDWSEEGPVDELKLHGGAGAGAEGPGGWAVTLEGLKLDNVGVLEVVTASLQLGCSRCSSSTTVQLTAQGGSTVSTISTVSTAAAGSTGDGGGTAAASSSSTPAASAAAAGGGGGSSGRAVGSSSSSRNSRAFEWGGSCSTCQQELHVLLRPRFVHEGSNILAGLKAVGCAPLDLLPSVYGATCADCDAVGALRGLQVGVPASRSCGHCHRAMAVSIPSVSFKPQGPPTGGRASGSRSGPAGTSRRGKGPGGSKVPGALSEGSPLPDNGACKHYRHSYRWLRFPCCGARYPCDLCHEEAVADGHDAAWATRMVCGFCSREQSLAPACKHCGKKLATSASKPSGRNTRHWEGGAGCRDMKMLDRRDAAKYRNSKAKTKSAKASRVGPKPWSGGAGGVRSTAE